MGESNIPKEELSGGKYIYDSYFHESDRISSRTDWFLIFHAILFEAFIAITHNTARIIIIGTVGILSSLIWWVNGLRAYRISWQLGKLMADEKVTNGEISKMHNKIFEERRNQMDIKRDGWAKHVPLYAVVTPFIFVSAWIALLIFSLPCQWSIGWSAAVIIPGSLVLLEILAWITWSIDKSFNQSGKDPIKYRSFICSVISIKWRKRKRPA